VDGGEGGTKWKCQQFRNGGPMRIPEVKGRQRAMGGDGEKKKKKKDNPTSSLVAVKKP